MTKNDVFLRLLMMYEQAEKQVNRLISGNDEQLFSYGNDKIEMIITQIAQQYKEAE